MKKEAKTIFGIHPLLRSRWSPRAFAPAPVEKQKLGSLFEAARWSASAGNQQPWRFILGIKEDDTWKNIFACLDAGNQKWAAMAPVLMIAAGRNLTNDGKGPNIYYQYDTGQSLAMMSVQAEHEGLRMHQMGGFDREKVRETFAIPAEYDPLTAIAVGYLGDPSQLDEFNRKRELAERDRIAASELVFSGMFGQASDMF